MLDRYHNHVKQGIEVELEIHGYFILDHISPKHKVAMLHSSLFYNMLYTYIYTSHIECHIYWFTITKFFLDLFFLAE